MHDLDSARDIYKNISFHSLELLEKFQGGWDVMQDSVQLTKMELEKILYDHNRGLGDVSAGLMKEVSRVEEMLHSLSLQVEDADTSLSVFKDLMHSVINTGRVLQNLSLDLQRSFELNLHLQNISHRALEEGLARITDLTSNLEGLAEAVELNRSRFLFQPNGGTTGWFWLLVAALPGVLKCQPSIALLLVIVVLLSGYMQSWSLRLRGYWHVSTTYIQEAQMSIHLTLMTLSFICFFVLVFVLLRSLLRRRRRPSNLKRMPHLPVQAARLPSPPHVARMPHRVPIMPFTSLPGFKKPSIRATSEPPVGRMLRY
ncbi:hypothetical protein BT69DRAFT_1320374 [Atractiella rhizophila]|nr:hypothetical protein BT69DRAFT_1320374 [Atractiella rhizophila]